MAEPMRKRSDRPFLERFRVDRKTGKLVEEAPLRERFPDYLKAFGIGVGAVTVVGVVLWAVTNMRLVEAIGYAWIFAGTTMLLVGGARGGGYSNLSIGAVEALVGGRNRTHDDVEEDADIRHGDVMKRRDPMDRLRRGLRPPPNPTAFWQTIAGFALIVMGLPLTL